MGNTAEPVTVGEHLSQSHCSLCVWLKWRADSRAIRSTVFVQLANSGSRPPSAMACSTQVLSFRSPSNYQQRSEDGNRSHGCDSYYDCDNRRGRWRRWAHPLREVCLTGRGLSRCDCRCDRLARLVVVRSYSVRVGPGKEAVESSSTIGPCNHRRWKGLTRAR